jgi:hypothetical protein
MPNVEFEITVVAKAQPADFPTLTECLEAIGRTAEDVVRPYGGRVINVDSKKREALADEHDVSVGRIAVVMKASGVFQS